MSQDNYLQKFTQNKIEKVERSKSFFVNNLNRVPVKIVVSFQHKTFHDNKGYMTLDVDDSETMRNVTLAIEEAIEKEITRLKEYKNSLKDD